MQNVYFIKGINTAFQKQQDVNPRTRKVPFQPYANNRSYNQPQQMKKTQFNSFSDNLKLPISQSFVKYPSMQMSSNYRNTFQHQISPKLHNEGALMLFNVLNKVKKDLSFNFLKQLDLYIKSITEQEHLNYLKNFDRGYQIFLQSCNLYQNKLQKLFFVKLCRQKTLSNYLLKICRDQNLSIAVPSNFHNDQLQLQSVPKKLFAAFREWKLNAISYKFYLYEKQRWIQQQAQKTLKIKSLINFLQMKKKITFIKLKSCLIEPQLQQNQTKKLFNKLQNVVIRTSDIQKIRDIKKSEAIQLSGQKLIQSVQSWEECNKTIGCNQIIHVLNCLIIGQKLDLFILCKQKTSLKFFPKLFYVLHNLVIKRKIITIEIMIKKPLLRQLHQLVPKLFYKNIRFGFYSILLTKIKKEPKQLNPKNLISFINVMESRILQVQQSFFRKLCIYESFQSSLIDVIKNISIVNHELSDKIKKKNLQYVSSERSIKVFQLLEKKQKNRLKEIKYIFQLWTSNITFPPKQYYEFVNLIKISQNEKEVILNEIDQLELSNNEMLFNQDQIKNQTLSEESSNRYRKTISQDGGNNQEEAIASQENMKMGFEYILFLQELVSSIPYNYQTVDLKYQYEGNEQIIQNEQQFYQNDLQRLEKQIQMLMKE